MSDEDGGLNYLKMVGSIPMPSELERRVARGNCNLHILDYLSWQLHPGWTMTQAMADPGIAYSVALSIAKPRHLSQPSN